MSPLVPAGSRGSTLVREMVLVSSTMTLLLFGGTTSSVLAMIALALGVLGGLWVIVAFVGWVGRKPWKGNRTMQKVIEELSSVIEKSAPGLLEIPEAESASKPAPSKWSKKEILGHLIDSAANNHQRFVRAQLSGELKIPDYEQEAWVKAEHFQDESWGNLVQLWKSYNLHLLHLLAAVPETALRNYCFIGENEPVTLEFLIGDYIKHLKHHLAQILE